MDLRVSVVLLFIFLTGGYSLRCYSCSSTSTGSCEATVETCPAGFSKCETRTISVTELSTTFKSCAIKCDPVTAKLPTGSVQCCDTDLCNAADGVYKGRFLLLFSPLLFYFLFQ